MSDTKKRDRARALRALRRHIEVKTGGDSAAADREMDDKLSTEWRTIMVLGPGSETPSESVTSGAKEALHDAGLSPDSFPETDPADEGDAKSKSDRLRSCICKIKQELDNLMDALD